MHVHKHLNFWSYNHDNMYTYTYKQAFVHGRYIAIGIILQLHVISLEFLYHGVIWALQACICLDNVLIYMYGVAGTHPCS